MLNNHVQDQLPFYINDTLTQAERASVELHLKNCEACRAELEEWQAIAVAVQNRATATTLPSLKLPPPSSAHRRIVSIVDYDEEHKSMNTSAIPMRTPLPRYGLSAMIAAGLIVAFAIGLIFQGFAPEPTPQNPRQVTGPTVYDVLKEDGRFTQLVAAIEQNEWAMSVVTGDDPVTVLAVPDEWFARRAALITDTTDTSSAQMEALQWRAFVFAHLINGEWTEAELREQELVESEFEFGDTTLADKNYIAIGPSGRTVLEGMGYIVEADIAAGNGIIQVLEAPITSPEYAVFPESLYEWLKADGRFSIFLSIADDDPMAFNMLNGAFSGALFVPTDAAFEAYFGQELDKFPFMAYGSEVVWVHMTHERYDIATLASLDSESYVLGIGAGGRIHLQTNEQEGRLFINAEDIANPVEILQADIPVSHGLVHVLDTPLLPEDYLSEEQLVAEGTVYDLLQADPRLSEFAHTIAENDWTADVAREELVTIFVLDNTQFPVLKGDMLNAQANVDVDLIEGFLFNHMLHYPATAEELAEQDRVVGSWSRGTYSYHNTIYIQQNADGVVRLNGQAHILESIAATNGFIHIIDAPIVSVESLVQATDTTDSSTTIPTIYDVLSVDPRFSIFKRYIDRIGQNSWLWHTLTSPTLGKSTLFVPTDDALMGNTIVMPPGENSYEQMVMAYLADGLWSLDSLATQGTVRSTWEPDGQTLTTTIRAEWSRAEPDTLIINNRARVIEGDIIAANGIIHVIDFPLNVEVTAVLPEISQPDTITIAPADTPPTLKTALDSMMQSADPTAVLNRQWENWGAIGQLPYIEGEQVAFLYRGEAETVEWRGDFNGWTNPITSLVGQRFAGTDLWIANAQFPTDARLDYKILVDGVTWLVDPANPNQQASGLGPNSELQMLDYVPSRWTTRRSFVPPGRLTPPSFGDILARSLGYIVNFQIYMPADYQNLENLPVIYVLDGHEYADEDLGALTIILDSMIAAGEIEPVMAVFIDPRDEDDKSINRREMEYAENDAFGDFLVQNLIPFIDQNYSTDPRPESRLLLGTSLGGRAALYFGVQEAFGLIAAQSPSIDPANTTFFSAIEESQVAPARIWISAGAPEWDVETTPLRAALLTKGYSVEYVQINEGHSWGNWRGVLDDMLIYFFGPSQ